ALAVVDLLPDERDDPLVAIEKIHVRGVAYLQDRPEDALAQFDEAERRWRELGNEEKIGWAHSNKALAYFVLGRMAETGRELDEADVHFTAAASRHGQMVVASMQQL